MFNHHQGGVAQILFEQEHVTPIQQELGCVGVSHKVRVEPGNSGSLGEPLREGPDGRRRQGVSIDGQEKGVLFRVGGFNRK